MGTPMRHGAPHDAAPALTKFGASVQQHWAWGQVANALILCSEGEGTPSEQELTSWISRLAVGNFDKLLIHSRGAPMSAKYRGRIGEFWRRSGRVMPPCALLTDSLAQRTVATAFTWLTRNSGVRAFASSELTDALRWLEADAAPTDVGDLIAGLSVALREKQRAGSHQRLTKVDLG